MFVDSHHPGENSVLPHCRRDTAHIGVCEQCRFDVSQLDSHTADLYLGISPTSIVQQTRRIHSHQIAGSVEPGACLACDESLGRCRCAAAVSTRQPGTAEIQLPDSPGRDRLQPVVEHECSHVIERSTDGDGLTGAQGFGQRGHHGRLTGSVGVEHRPFGRPVFYDARAQYVSADSDGLDTVGRWNRRQYPGCGEVVGDAMLGEEIRHLVTTEQVGRCDDHRRPGPERQHEFENGCIEVDRVPVQYT